MPTKIAMKAARAVIECYFRMSRDSNRPLENIIHHAAEDIDSLIPHEAMNQELKSLKYTIDLSLIRDRPSVLIDVDNSDIARLSQMLESYRKAGE